MARIFISYAAADRGFAVELHAGLVSEGHQVFLDRDPGDGIAAGDEWEQRLYERLRWADAVVCPVSAAFGRSQWCLVEVAIARSRGSRVIPLLIEPGADYAPLRTIQHLDYFTDPVAARSALLELLRRLDAAGGRGWPDGRSPFPGLKAFDTDMHRAFFGRGPEIEALAALLRSPAERADGALLLVVGPSGCGKSSLVRAGLLPVMAEEAEWLAIPPFFPGRNPLSALASEFTVSGLQLGMDWTLAKVRDRLGPEDGLAGLAAELLVAASGSACDAGTS
jgi:hypothetical protein